MIQYATISPLPPVLLFKHRQVSRVASHEGVQPLLRVTRPLPQTQEACMVSTCSKPHCTCILIGSHWSSPLSVLDALPETSCTAPFNLLSLISNIAVLWSRYHLPAKWIPLNSSNKQITWQNNPSIASSRHSHPNIFGLKGTRTPSLVNFFEKNPRRGAKSSDPAKTKPCSTYITSCARHVEKKQGDMWHGKVIWPSHAGRQMKRSVSM